jgi:hypothetical protein
MLPTPQIAGSVPGKSKFPPRLSLELAICTALFLLGTLFVWNTSHRISTGLRNLNADDVWFEADVGRVFYNISARHSDQGRSQVHPILALASYPFCASFHRFLGLDLNGSADLFMALAAGLWTVLMYAVVRRLGFDRVLAFLAAVMGLFTTSALLFFAVPENYQLSSISILLSIALIVFTEGTPNAESGAILASAASLSMTVTNWSLGLLLTIRRYSFRKWLQISINAFFVVALLWSIEKAFMPTAQFFTAVAGERQFVHKLSLDGLVHTAVVFVSHSIVAPRVHEVDSFGPGEDPIGPVWKTGLSMQSLWPGAGSPLGVVLAPAWLAILATGIVTLARQRTGIAIPMLAFLAAQFLLHSLYGVETILYSLDWTPVLVIVSVYAFQRMGRLSWPAMALFVALLAANNYSEFRHVAELVDSYQQAHRLAPPADTQQMLPAQ